MRFLVAILVLVFPLISYAEVPVFEIGGKCYIMMKPNPESDLAGYNLYVREITQDFGSPFEVDKSQMLVDKSRVYTDCAIFNFTVPGDYRLIATAFDTSGNESGPTNEIPFKIVANKAPPKPTMVIKEEKEFDTQPLYNQDEREIVVTFPKPSGFTVFASMVMIVHDPDFPDEGHLFINGNGPINLFGSGSSDSYDAIDAEIILDTPSMWWKHGKNVLKFRHVKTAGYKIVSINDVIFK